MNDWYATLERPPLTPPDWVFGPAWTVLYAMIALAIALYAWHTRARRPWPVYALIALHLATNLCWTPIFFGLRRTGWALVDLAVLDVTLGLMIVVFWRAYRPASILLWPYLAWVLFATYLNAGFHILNG